MQARGERERLSASYSINRVFLFKYRHRYNIYRNAFTEGRTERDTATYEAEPSSKHAAIGAAKGNHGAGGDRAVSSLERGDQLCVIGQRL